LLAHAETRRLISSRLNVEDNNLELMPRDSRLLRVRSLYTNAVVTASYVKGRETDGKPVFNVAIASAIKIHVST